MNLVDYPMHGAMKEEPLIYSSGLSGKKMRFSYKEKNSFTLKKIE